MKKTTSKRKQNRKNQKLKRRAVPKGNRAFVDEICRLSYTPELACFCTPGHHRGAAM